MFGFSRQCLGYIFRKHQICSGYLLLLDNVTSRGLKRGEAPRPLEPFGCILYKSCGSCNLKTYIKAQHASEGAAKESRGRPQSPLENPSVKLNFIRRGCEGVQGATAKPSGKPIGKAQLYSKGLRRGAGGDRKAPCIATQLGARIRLSCLK